MNGKKLIRKMWLPLIAVFITGIVGLIVYEPILDSEYEDYLKESEKYLKTFTNEQQKYLQGVAEKINSLEPNEKFISKFESEYLLNDQITNKNKKFIWLEAKQGEVVFGVPSESFNILLNGYKKHKNTIESDGYFKSKNDFLTKLINESENVDFSEWTNNNRDRYYLNWRYYKENRWEKLPSTILQEAVVDRNGKVIGKLYLKILDLENKEKYYSKSQFRSELFISNFVPFFVLFSVISGLFLWFLMPTWVYIDAQQRDVQNPLTWAILTLISLFFGLVIYLITRPATIKSQNCPCCDNELNGTRAYCPHCGHDLTSNFCQNCEYPIKPEWKFCPGCRTEIKSNKNILPESSSGEDVQI